MGECVKARVFKCTSREMKANISFDKEEYLTALCNIPPSLCYKRGEGSLVKGFPILEFGHRCLLGFGVSFLFWCLGFSLARARML